MSFGDQGLNSASVPLACRLQQIDWDGPSDETAETEVLYYIRLSTIFKTRLYSKAISRSINVYFAALQNRQCPLLANCGWLVGEDTDLRKQAFRFSQGATMFKAISQQLTLAHLQCKEAISTQSSPSDCLGLLCPKIDDK